ncbi:hypothetical protein BDB00DRAFT_867392 [Zychaea mexicana]|uniref:uncharacterized protein n=1 Tax=Zychaea mexicana TaxID=64656 RepID=UPI0022FF0DAA|nr:uncharacterized protein BDB00DRAFT_867392 [Zychaea mexicana]KAI9498776.1 hypothetical protein BDB00DRAFT_867392 [Zychaea mexicana]
MSTTTAGLHRGYSCPSLVSAKTTKPIQHSLSVSLSACQQQHQLYHRHHHHHPNHQQQQQPPQLQSKQKQTIDLRKEELEEDDDKKPTKEEEAVVNEQQEDDSAFSLLTEANLKEHTTLTAYGRESRHRRVKCYVDSQMQLLRLEAELERRRRMEIRSLVPLDTHSYDQDVILSANDYNDDHPFENNDDDDKNSNNSNHSEDIHNQQRRKSSSKLSSFSRVRRWFSLRKSPSSALRSNRGAEQQQQLDKNKKKYTISFEQYQQEKAALVGQGLNGLSNQNIARALGAGGLASLVFSPSPSPADESQITSVITTTASQQQQHNHQKRDSGVSLFSRSTSKKGGSGSGDRQMVPGQQQQQQHNSHSGISRSNSFVTARYPKMIHLKALRGAAIQALSSDFSLGEESIYCCTNSSDLPNCCCPR